MKKLLNSNKGMSLILLTMMVSVLFLVIVNVLNHFRSRHTDALLRTRRLLVGMNLMRSFGTTVQRAYDVARLNGGACPAGTFSVGSTIATPPWTTNFCFPAVGTNGNGNCINGYCLDGLNNATAQNESMESVIEARLSVPLSERASEQLTAWADLLFEKLDQLSPTAHAQRINQLAQAPAAGATDNRIANIVCPGNAVCRACRDNGGFTRNLHCITLRVCPLTSRACGAAEFWVQRYGIRSM